MKTAKSIIVVLFVLLTAQIAYAYYCPSTGRWLSRDPIGEPGFENLRAANISLPNDHTTPMRLVRWVKRDPIQYDPSFELKELNHYVCVQNNLLSKIDMLGLTHYTTHYTWAAKGCGKDYYSAYIQVGLGGSTLYPSPFVDDGLHGPASSSPNYPPLYPNSADGAGTISAPDTGIEFDDTAKVGGIGIWGLKGLKFEVCRVCLKQCCGTVKGARKPTTFDGYQIVKIGPCVTYTLSGVGGDVDLSIPGNATGSDDNASAAFTQTLSSAYPNISRGGCIGKYAGYSQK